jgi:hypothetical protein
VGFFAILEKYFLVAGDGWDRKIHNFSDGGKVCQES